MNHRSVNRLQISPDDNLQNWGDIKKECEQKWGGRPSLSKYEFIDLERGEEEPMSDRRSAVSFSSIYNSLASRKAARTR
jgi:hypothetical protein